MLKAEVSRITLVIFVILLIIVGAGAFTAGRLAKETVTVTVKPETITMAHTVTETVRETETVTETEIVTTTETRVITETVTKTITETVAPTINITEVVEEAIGKLFLNAITLHYITQIPRT